MTSTVDLRLASASVRKKIEKNKSMPDAGQDVPAPGGTSPEAGVFDIFIDVDIFRTLGW